MASFGNNKTIKLSSGFAAQQATASASQHGLVSMFTLTAGQSAVITHAAMLFFSSSPGGNPTMGIWNTNNINTNPVATLVFDIYPTTLFFPSSGYTHIATPKVQPRIELTGAATYYFAAVWGSGPTAIQTLLSGSIYANTPSGF